MGTDLARRPVGHDRPVRGPDRARTITAAHETEGVPDEASNYSKVRSTPLARCPESDHPAARTACQTERLRYLRSSPEPTKRHREDPAERYRQTARVTDAGLHRPRAPTA